MYDFNDLRGPLPKCTPKQNSILDIISQPCFSIFHSLVKTARMEGVLGAPQADFTIFVASDDNLRKRYTDGFFINIDQDTATRIIRGSILYNRLPMDILTVTPLGYYYTYDRSTRLLIKTNGCGEVRVNGLKIIEGDISCVNGIIHILDDFIIPNRGNMMERPIQI